MSERREAIIRLLETRSEHLPEPRRRTEGSAGFVHQTLAPTVCETCEGVDSFGCTGCGGRGWVERARSRDPYAVDAVVPYGLGPDRHEAVRERDRQIQMLERQVRPASAVDELADANASPYAWERARRRMYQEFDYAALDRVVERFRAAFPGHSVYGELGLTFLDEQLPDPLRAPDAPKPVRVRGPVGPGAGSAVKDTRDAEMRARVLDGASPAEIAAEFRVSIRTVYQIVSQAA